jgi:hypothetical protein
MARDYSQYMDQLMAQRQGSLEGIQKQIEQRQAMHDSFIDKVNLKPAAAFVDAMTGSSMAGSFGGPTPYEKNQDVINKLKGALAQGEDQLAQDAISFFKAQAYKDQVDRQGQGGRDPFDEWYKRENLRLKEKGLDQRAAQKSEGPTVGQDAVDRAFGKTYEEEFLSGKINSAEKNIEQLGTIRNELATRDDLTGGFTGNLPMAIRRRTAPDSANAQQVVEDVVQQSLKAILGAQFTEKEAARLIERAYDPALDEDKNLERVDRLYRTLKKGIEAKKKAGSYFEQAGTMRGYKGTMYNSVDDILNDFDSTGGNEKKDKAQRLRELELKMQGGGE